MSPIDALRALDTCVVSDALDHLGLPGATIGLRPLWPVAVPLVGRVRTVRAGARTPASPGTHIATAAVESARPGDVIVIANDGRTDVSCWGGILTNGAIAAGVAGVVIDGACRDIVESETLGLPMFGRAVVPVSARGRIVQLAMDVTITIAGVEVHPDDIVIADACGTVFVPAARVEDVVAQAAALLRREAEMIEAVRAGRSIVDTMQDSRFAVTADAPA